MPKELRDFSPGPRIMPTTEAGYLEKYDQETQFEKWQADERARQQAILDSERDAYQWYIRCRACYDHGVYLTHPIGIGDVLGRGDWYARYKPTPEAYWDRPLLCQWCLHKGSEVRLDVEVIDIWKHTFKPAARWLWKAAKDKDRFLIEGNIRAVLLPYGACNTQIEDIERRHELHKQWLAEKAEKEKEAKKIHG